MHSRRIIHAIIAILISSTPTLAADIMIEVKGASSAQGNILVALFDDPATFLNKPARGVKRSADAATAVAVFRDLKPGTYAATAIHDENRNGLLDQNRLGRPTEQYGFSRDATGRMGPPSFDAASFSVGAANQTLVIDLH